MTTRDLAGSLRRHIDDTLRGINPGAGLRMESRQRRTAGNASAAPSRATYPYDPGELPAAENRQRDPRPEPSAAKDPVQGGGGLRARWTDSDGNIYEWDRMHGTLEKYGKGGEHLGEYDPVTGDQTKPAKPGRNIKNYL